MKEFPSNRINPNEAQVLELGDSVLLSKSNFDIYLPTKIYSHGWIGDPSAQGWGIRDGYLQTEDCNFIAVDWSVLARGDFADVARTSVPIVGEVTGSFIDFLVEHGASLRSFHLIGFSMGAHVVAIAAKTTKMDMLPRITGAEVQTIEFHRSI